MTFRPNHSVVHTIAVLAALMVSAAGFTPAAHADTPDEPPESPPKEEPPYRRYHVGTSLFTLFNLLPDDQPPAFGMVNFGVRLTPKDVLTFEAITWQYWEPVGIPYGPQKGNPDNAFRDRVRGIGVGVAYQRFLWRGAYVALHATPLHQTYLNPEGKRIQSGFQLFMTARAGYHVAFAKNRLFIEPSIAFTAWPINTNRPDDFAAVEDEWPRYFLFEPGMHAGVKF